MSREQLTLPGLVDVHVHHRGFDQADKEDPETCSRAALAAGVTAYAAMPNYAPESVQPYNLDNMRQVQAQSAGRLHTDIGHWGAYQPKFDSVGELESLLPATVGIKMYMDQTTGNNVRHNPRDFLEAAREIHRVAPQKVIAAHVEDDGIEDAIGLIAGDIGHRLHIPHVNNRFVMGAIVRAKRDGLPVSAGVTPHHLFLDERDVTSWRQRMKPVLGTSDDQDYLWHELQRGVVDVIETDHAPHTRHDKIAASDEKPCYGVPGLDAMLPLLLHEATASDARLSIEDIERLCVDGPKRLLNLTDHSTGTVTVDMHDYEFTEQQVRSKCGWSPYVGRMVTGRVTSVERGGRTLYYSRPLTNDKTVWRDRYMRPAQGKVLFSAEEVS